MSTYFTKDHEWLKIEGDIATVGITDFAQNQLGDVVYVELPESGKTVAQEDEVAVVESVKAASEVYAPIDGEIVEGNELLVDEPAKVNEAAESDAWFFKMKLGNAAQLEELMSEADYKAFVETL